MKNNGKGQKEKKKAQKRKQRSGRPRTCKKDPPSAARSSANQSPLNKCQKKCVFSDTSSAELNELNDQLAMMRNDPRNRLPKNSTTTGSTDESSESQQATAKPTKTKKTTKQTSLSNQAQLPTFPHDNTEDHAKDDSSCTTTDAVSSPKKKPLPKNKAAEVPKRPVASSTTGKSMLGGRPTLLAQLAQFRTPLSFSVSIAIRTNKKMKKPSSWPTNEQLHLISPGYHDDNDITFVELDGKIKDMIEEEFPGQFETIEDYSESPDGYYFVDAKNGSTSARQVWPFDELTATHLFGITGDASLDTALEHYASVHTIGEEKKSKALHLSILVWVSKVVVSQTVSTTTETKRRAKKTDFNRIKFELLPLVEKHNSNYVTSSTTPISDFTLSTEATETLGSIGEIRKRIAEHAMDCSVKPYVQDDGQMGFGHHSSLYIVPDFRTAKVRKVETYSLFKELLEERAGKAKAIVSSSNGDRVLSVRVAMGKMLESDTPYDFENKSMSDIVLESQGANPYGSPAPKAEKKRGAKAEVLDEEVLQLVQRIYNDEESPYYHGFTKSLETCLKRKLQHYGGIAENVLEAFANKKEWPSQMDLFGALHPNETHPERCAFPPGPDDGPPLDKPQPKKKDSILAVADVLREIVTSPSSTPASSSATQAYNAQQILIDQERHERSSFFRFRRNREGPPVFVDVALYDEFPELQDGTVNSGVNPNADDFGKRLLKKAYEKDMVGVFHMNGDEKQRLNGKTAAVFFELAGGMSYVLEDFQKLTKEQLTRSFSSTNNCTLITLNVKNIVQQTDQWDGWGL